MIVHFAVFNFVGEWILRAAVTIEEAVVCVEDCQLSPGQPQTDSC